MGIRGETKNTKIIIEQKESRTALLPNNYDEEVLTHQNPTHLGLIWKKEHLHTYRYLENPMIDRGEARKTRISVDQARNASDLQTRS